MKKDGYTDLIRVSKMYDCQMVRNGQPMVQTSVLKCNLGITDKHSAAFSPIIQKWTLYKCVGNYKHAY